MSAHVRKLYRGPIVAKQVEHTPILNRYDDPWGVMEWSRFDIIERATALGLGYAIPKEWRV